MQKELLHFCQQDKVLISNPFFKKKKKKLNGTLIVDRTKRSQELRIFGFLSRDTNVVLFFGVFFCGLISGSFYFLKASCDFLLMAH